MRPFPPAQSPDLMPRIVDLPIEAIFDGDRLRAIDPAWSAAMAASIEAGAELPPIVVRPPEPGEDFPGEYALVAGGHRLDAHRLADRLTIRAEIRPLSRLQARLVEIDENLFRHELNTLDRAIFLAERRRVWDELHPEAVHGGDRKSRNSKGKIKSQTLRLDPRRFTQEAAERCNLSERTVQAALALANSLTPETVELLRGTAWARNASELQRLAAEPAERQVMLARIHAQGEALTVAKARIAVGDAPTGEGDPQEELFRRIVANWERLDAKGRKRFLEHAGLMAKPSTRERMPKVSEIIGGKA